MFDEIMGYDTGKDYTQTKKDKDEIITALVKQNCADKIKIKQLEETVDLLGKPCKCNPIGSGEEYCNGGCEMREEIARLRAALEEIIEFNESEHINVNTRSRKIARIALEESK